MKILVINGPNLNILGVRDPKHYGDLTLGQINGQLDNLAKPLGIKLKFFQSNHEGNIIDFIQSESGSASGILINPGALTHYGYSLRDALFETGLPIVEVHLSDPDKREKFRKVNVLEGISLQRFKGLKERSYLKGMEMLVKHIRHEY